MYRDPHASNRFPSLSFLSQGHDSAQIPRLWDGPFRPKPIYSCIHVYGRSFMPKKKRGGQALPNIKNLALQTLHLGNFTSQLNAQNIRTLFSQPTHLQFNQSHLHQLPNKLSPSLPLLVPLSPTYPFLFDAPKPNPDQTRLNQDRARRLLRCNLTKPTRRRPLNP